jgi:hypothetical protein
MDYKKYFVRIIKKTYPGTYETLLPEIERAYKVTAVDTKFAATSGNPMDKRLDFSAYFLALIQVLEKQGASYEEIRETCLVITHAYVRPKNKWQAWLKQLPPKLIHTKLSQVFIKILDRKISTQGHPDGFVAKVITDPQETFGLGYGIDILECGICKLFRKHHAEKYASILCEVDKLTSGLAGLALVRSGTIANGADKCDFRFKKKTF